MVADEGIEGCQGDMHPQPWDVPAFRKRRVCSRQLVAASVGITLISAAVFLWLGLWNADSVNGSGEGSLFVQPFRKILNGLVYQWWNIDPRGKVLVVYVFANTDGETEENLHYFVREGCHPSLDVDYLFIVQEGTGILPRRRPLPDLPPNARLIFHKNECYDWGTIGWALARTWRHRYQYFVFMNSSVRGPFMPAYYRGKLTWLSTLLAKLNREVKLVGCTINCEQCPPPTDKPWADYRHNPHVQSYVLATDRVGLAVMEAEGNVFKCHSERADAIYYSEVGSSAAILKAGYNIDSLLLRYQGVDWRNRSTWTCNSGMNPYMEQYMDDTSVHPLESMFTKVKAHLLEDWTHTARTAAKYTQWRVEQDAHGQVEDISSNDFLRHLPLYKAARVMVAATWKPDCWDMDYYRLMNADIPADWSLDRLRQHLLHQGLVEARPFRFNCSSTAKELRRSAGIVSNLVDRLLIWKRFNLTEADAS